MVFPGFHRDLYRNITYVTQFDNNRFFSLYVDLLTRPVPITLP